MHQEVGDILLADLRRVQHATLLQEHQIATQVAPVGLDGVLGESTLDTQGAQVLRDGRRQGRVSHLRTPLRRTPVSRARGSRSPPASCESVAAAPPRSPRATAPTPPPCALPRLPAPSVQPPAPG